tara:strand:- start:859 stop:1005 length:147 start_codon:yes stop_codon:yes gene_type:complete
MPFSGGSSGQTGVSAHVHSNSVGDGGSLSTSATLIADGNLYSRIVAGA